MSESLSNIEFREVWKNKETYASSVNFWQSLFTKNTFDLKSRSKQVIYHVLRDNKIIGISTAEECLLANFENNNFYNYRMLIHPEYRIPGMADTLAVKSINFLEDLYIKKKSNAIGVITLIEDQLIIEKKQNLIYRATKLMFAGYTKNGSQIRLKYFKGARI